MKRALSLVVFVAILTLACGYLYAGEGKEVHKEFDGVKKIKLNTVSGDCIIKTHGSSKVEIDLYYDVDPEKAFKYRMQERQSSLIIKEEWRGHSTSGEVVWTLTVPKDTKIEFSTASGDIEVTGLAGSIEASTASGDVKIEDVSCEVDISTASGDIDIVNARGEMDLSTASGDIRVEGSSEEIELSTASGDIDAVGLEGEISLGTASGDIDISDSQGIFDLGCASGSVEAENIIIKGASEFSTASGSVKVILAETSQYDLELSTASGNVLLDYNGNDIEGYFEFEARKRRGRIVAPFNFDDEEEYERHDETYMRKSFTRKSKTPEIYLSTASGKVELRK
ncbi:MAG: DUF4097 family beta strand repeat protein [Candidatus Krumholzibacteriota bacterium]|nr:DUF4097 family beta strand repeat protein [Candidatus Krumholzibacteriota bacterium]